MIRQACEDNWLCAPAAGAKTLAGFVVAVCGDSLHGRCCGSESLIDNFPECGNHCRLSVEEILEKHTVVQGRRIRIPFTIIAQFCDPVIRFVRIDNFE